MKTKTQLARPYYSRNSFEPLDYVVTKAEILSTIEDSTGRIERKILSTFYMKDNPKRLLQYHWKQITLSNHPTSTPLSCVHGRHLMSDFLHEAICVVPEKPITIPISDYYEPFVVIADNCNADEHCKREQYYRLSPAGERYEKVLSIVLITKAEQNRRKQSGRSAPSKQMDFSWERIARDKVFQRQYKFKKVKTIFNMLKKAVGSKNAIMELRKAGML